MSKETKSNSNVSLLLGIIILVGLVATSAIFSNHAYADNGSKVKKYLESLKKAEAEKKALEEQKAKEEAAKKAKEEKAAAEKKALEEKAAAEKKALEEAESAVQEDSSGDSSDTTPEESTIEEEVIDTNEDSSDTTDVSNEETSSETDEIDQTPINDDIPVIVETPIEDDVEPEVTMNVAMDHIEDSSDGKMVYIKGDGARESSKVIISIFGENNDEIVELGIYSTNRGEFSTVWIANKDMNIEGTYLIKAQSHNNKAESAFTLNGQVVEIIKDVPVETTTNNGSSEDSGMEIIDDLKDKANNPNIGLEQKVSILESLVGAMQGIITTLSTSLQNYQNQIDEESKARQAADEELKTKLSEISEKPYKLVSYQRAMYVTIASGEQSSHTITCPDEDVAQNGGIDIKSYQVPQFKTFVNRMEGANSWHVQASNTNPTESVEMTLYINCLRVETTNQITTASESQQATS